MRSLRVFPAVAVLLVSGALAPLARADGLTATLNPAATGAGSHLLLDAQGAAGGLRPRTLPSGLTIGLQRGFTIDPGAVAGICTDAEAGSAKCPANSIIGTGTFDLHAEGFAFGPKGQDFSAQLTFYRATARQPGDPMGVVFNFREATSGFHGESIGRLQTLDDPVLGQAFVFDKLPIPSLPSGFTFTLNRMRLDIGAGAATPPVRVHKPKPRKHRCRKVVKRLKNGHHKTVFVCPKKKKAKAKAKASSAAVAHSAQDGLAFLANPVTCTGSWRVELDIAYGADTEKHPADAPCTAAP